MKKFTIKSKIAIVILAIVLAFVVACAIYVSDYYHAETDAIAVFEQGNLYSVNKDVLEDNTIIYESENSKKGFIFYPGGKVEYIAYEPLIKELSEEGYLCVLLEMPFNLAILDTSAASGIIEQYPQIEEWYIGGHSLGGSAAAMYVSDNLNQYSGLILLASYSTDDLSSTDLRTLSIFGSEDKVLNMEKYEECLLNLPRDYEEVVIEGGCHAYFGMYGEQEGDGTATITNEEQIHIAVDEIAEFMN